MHPRHNRDICRPVEPRCTSSKTMVLQSIFFIPLATEPTAGPQVRSSVARSFKTEHKGTDREIGAPARSQSFAWLPSQRGSVFESLQPQK
jgi:hypothetical protein